ncbi:hypothetical protein BDW68DRAFT_176616 [Aspergillus falconensis]
MPKGSWCQVLQYPGLPLHQPDIGDDPRRHTEKGKNVATGLASLLLALSGVSQEQRRRVQVHLDKWFNFFLFNIVGEAGRDTRDAIARELAFYASIVGEYVRIHHLTVRNPWMRCSGYIPTSLLLHTCLAAIESRKRNPEAGSDMMEQWLSDRNTQPDRMAEEEFLVAGVDILPAKEYGIFESYKGSLIKRKGGGVVKYLEEMGLPYLRARMGVVALIQRCTLIH